ncbi:hypothetical protein HanIR_Chr01g0028841 [Helianthus annuus]|nr:hypothetical protein HanIR_Chr01g0028841 [Helianthus annuus]
MLLMVVHEYHMIVLIFLTKYLFTILDIRFTIRIRIRKFGYPNFGYPNFRIRIRIVKLTIRNFRISEIRISEFSDIRF